MSRPGVRACLAAARDLSQLRHDLTVLHAPALDPGALPSLRASGDRTYERSRAFLDWVRRQGAMPDSLG